MRLQVPKMGDFVKKKVLEKKGSRKTRGPSSILTRAMPYHKRPKRPKRQKRPKLQKRPNCPKRPKWPKRPFFVTPLFGTCNRITFCKIRRFSKKVMRLQVPKMYGTVAKPLQLQYRPLDRCNIAFCVANSAYS